MGTYVKATAVGILVGLLSAIPWVFAHIDLPLYWAALISQLRNDGRRRWVGIRWLGFHFARDISRLHRGIRLENAAGATREPRRTEAARVMAIA